MPAYAPGDCQCCTCFWFDHCEGFRSPEALHFHTDGFTDGDIPCSLFNGDWLLRSQYDTRNGYVRWLSCQVVGGTSLWVQIYYDPVNNALWRLRLCAFACDDIQNRGCCVSYTSTTGVSNNNPGVCYKDRDQNFDRYFELFNGVTCPPSTCGSRPDVIHVTAPGGVFNGCGCCSTGDPIRGGYGQPMLQTYHMTFLSSDCPNFVIGDVVPLTLIIGVDENQPITSWEGDYTSPRNGVVYHFRCFCNGQGGGFADLRWQVFVSTCNGIPARGGFVVSNTPSCFPFNLTGSFANFSEPTCQCSGGTGTTVGVTP